MEELKLSPPWAILYSEIEALFAEDPDIKTDYDEEAHIIRIYVEGSEKADALTQLLPTEKTFGGVTVKIQVIPANLRGLTRLQLFQKAFKGNPAFFSVEATDGIFDRNFVLFKPKVVQFYADDLSDFNGLKTTLYQDIAKDVFSEVPGVYFCTAPVE